jgi:hypothetical protein
MEFLAGLGSERVGEGGEIESALRSVVISYYGNQSTNSVQLSSVLIL